MFTLLALLAAAAQTGSPPPGANILDRNRIDRAPTVTRRAKAPRLTSVDADAPTTMIRGIRFTGAKAPAPVAHAARRYLGKTASKDNLAALASGLSDAYGDSDVALYSVAIPAQSFDGGVVEVALTEGRIVRASIVNRRPGAYRQLKARMAPLMTAGPLPRARFERQLTLMRAIPGLTIDPAFADPRHDGALALTVTPTQKRHSFSAGFNNRGPSLLGDGQFDGRAEFYGAAADGDQVTLAASASSDLSRYRYGSAGYAAPIGGSGLTASATGAYLETRPRGTDVRGRAKQAVLALSYPAIRTFTRSADVSVSLDGVDSDNAAFGNLIATERTRAARVAASIGDTRERRSWSVSGAIARGLDVLGARVTAPLADASFTKATLAAAAGQAIGKRVTARVSASAQASGDALPAAERFAIGGEAIGRAFDTALLSGDRGAGGSAELALRPLTAGTLAASEVYGFADAGRVTVLARGPLAREHYSLASAGVGVRARYREKAELGLEAAWVVDRPYAGYDEDWRLSVAWRLNL